MMQTRRAGQQAHPLPPGEGKGEGKFTLTPNPSPKGEGKNGAAQRDVARSSFLGGNIKLTHYR
jgi:hypothetical protein